MGSLQVAILLTGVNVVGDLEDLDGQLEMQVEDGDGGGAFEVAVDEESLDEGFEGFRFAIRLPTAEAQGVSPTAVPGEEYEERSDDNTEVHYGRK